MLEIRYCGTARIKKLLNKILLSSGPVTDEFGQLGTYLLATCHLQGTLVPYKSSILCLMPDTNPVDCRWSDYSDWTDCSVTCGSGGVQTRERTILLLARRGGRPCSGESKETRQCNLQKCPRKTRHRNQANFLEISQLTK